MITITLLLLVLALLATIGTIWERLPLWIAVLLLTLAMLIGHVADPLTGGQAFGALRRAGVSKAGSAAW